MDCKHIYEMKVVLRYIKKEDHLASCLKMLLARRVVCDSVLHIDIYEYHSTNIQTTRPTMVADFTELEEDD
ncbi:hypothetical protein MKX01_027383 [Papaver californicum]|nr:hypothetical protein MKX01_027383 [Papaver californicum]